MRHVIGASTGGDPGSGGALLLGATADQLLLDGWPVQAHVALRGVHRLGDPEAVVEQVLAERQGGVPMIAAASRCVRGRRMGVAVNLRTFRSIHWIIDRRADSVHP